MEKFVELEPVELNDAELAAVAGGAFSVNTTNASVSNSFNGSGNVAVSNSSITNSSV
jgi:hypothetical protein